MKSYWFIIVLLLVFFSCGSGNEAGEAKDSDPVEVLFNQVMKVHDEAMAKMDSIFDLIAELREEKTGIAGDSDMEMEIDAAIDQLKAADDGMMDWMSAFKKPAKTTPENEALAYLKNEQKSVRKVAADIETSLKKGRSVRDKAKAK